MSEAVDFLVENAARLYTLAGEDGPRLGADLMEVGT